MQNVITGCKYCEETGTPCTECIEGLYLSLDKLECLELCPNGN